MKILYKTIILFTVKPITRILMNKDFIPYKTYYQTFSRIYTFITETVQEINKNHDKTVYVSVALSSNILLDNNN